MGAPLPAGAPRRLIRALLKLLLAILLLAPPSAAQGPGSEATNASREWQRRLGGWTVARYQPGGVPRCEAERQQPGLGMLRVARQADGRMDFAVAAEGRVLAPPDSRVEVIFGQVNEELERTEGRADATGVVRFRDPSTGPGTMNILLHERIFVVGTEAGGTLRFSLDGAAAPLRLMLACPARP